MGIYRSPINLSILTDVVLCMIVFLEVPNSSCLEMNIVSCVFV